MKVAGPDTAVDRKCTVNGTEGLLARTSNTPNGFREAEFKQEALDHKSRVLVDTDRSPINCAVWIHRTRSFPVLRALGYQRDAASRSRQLMARKDRRDEDKLEGGSRTADELLIVRDCKSQSTSLS